MIITALFWQTGEAERGEEERVEDKGKTPFLLCCYKINENLKEMIDKVDQFLIIT